MSGDKQIRKHEISTSMYRIHPDSTLISGIYSAWLHLGSLTTSTAKKARFFSVYLKTLDKTVLQPNGHYLESQIVSEDDSVKVEGDFYFVAYTITHMAIRQHC